MKRQQQIQAHFDQEAAEFDATIQKIIPYYDQLIEALVASIPFQKAQSFSVIDLGCGTGTVAQAIQQAYPHAELTCVDLSQEMLTLAKHKLGPDINCLACSFEELTFDQTYDVAVSSLALHHLDNLAGHRQFYQKLYQALNPGGLFINADVVKAGNPQLQAVFMEKWIAFMQQQISMQEIQERWLKSHFEEDRPVALISELQILEEIGFQNVDVVYKYYNYAVYLGQKRTSDE
ncbi:methyltransferase domain-containing protein [Erwinia sp. CPCC 100877]|nr:methyltransferase domain-containing protein [Erwinia sp. CPCC 100877]